jgi:hypothetical protein
LLHSINPSFITAWDICPEATRRKYIYGEPSPIGIDGHIGLSFHKVVELDLKSILTSDLKLGKNSLLGTGHLEYVAGLERGVYIPREDIPRAQQIMSEGKNMVDRLVEYYVDNPENKIVKYRPHAVEEIVTMESPFEFMGQQLPFKGIIDVICKVKNSIIIRDTKTSKRKWSQEKADTSYQATVYYAAAKELYGKAPDNIFFDVYIKNKKGVDYEEIETKRTEEDFEFLKRRVQQILGCMQEGYFPPCDPNHWHCTPKWCNFWLSCPYITNRSKQDYLDKTRTLSDLKNMLMSK